MKSKLYAGAFLILLFCPTVRTPKCFIAAKDGSNGMLLDRASAAEPPRNTYYFYCLDYAPETETTFYSDSFGIEGDDRASVAVHLELAFAKWLQTNGSTPNMRPRDATTTPV